MGEKDLSKDSELMEKLKELARNSKNDNSFDTQKFTDLLKEYTGNKKCSGQKITFYFPASNMTNTNTLVTDKLVQILYNFLNEKKMSAKSAPALVKKKVKVIKPECANPPQILGRLHIS